MDPWLEFWYIPLAKNLVIGTIFAALLYPFFPIIDRLIGDSKEVGE